MKMDREDITVELIKNLVSDCEDCGKSFNKPKMVKFVITDKKSKRLWSVLCTPCYIKERKPKKADHAISDTNNDYGPSHTTWFDKDGELIQRVDVFINDEGKLDVKLSKR